MGDVQDLFRRAAGWKHDAAELDKTMADISASSEAHVAAVCDAARELLDNARRGSNSGLKRRSIRDLSRLRRSWGKNELLQVDVLPYPAGWRSPLDAGGSVQATSLTRNPEASAA